MTTPPAPKVFVYYATVLRVHDGDTLFVQVDQGMGIWNLGDDRAGGFGIRLAGINAPELSTAAGRASFAYLQSLVHPADTIRLESLAWHEHEKYGRLLAVVYLLDGTNVCDALVAGGYAKIWDGSGPKPV